MMQEAYDWYVLQQQDLGDSFISVLESAFLKISSHPEYYGIVIKKYRQIKIAHFPYVIIYEIIQDSVVVYAVFHTSKNPKKKFRNKK